MTMPYVLMTPEPAGPADEWGRLGLAAHVGGQVPDAERHYLSALRVEPGHLIATQNLAILYAQTWRLLEGLMTIERATMLDPTAPLPWANWSLMALEAERYDEALDAAAQGCKTAATPETQTALAMALTARGRAADAVPLYDRVLDTHPTRMMASYNACFVRTLTATSSAEGGAARRRWYEAHRFQGDRAPHANARTLDRPLRVGYVSGDFKRHSAAFLFGTAALHHDLTAVAPYFYSTLPTDVRSWCSAAVPNRKAAEWRLKSPDT